MTTVIIDYGAGNLQSAQKAFERAAADLPSSQKVIVTGRVEDLQKATRIVLPGVGSFSDCKAGILAIDGMMEALRHSVIDLGLPFLGICVGMQLLATRSLENGEHQGFKWVQGDVVKIKGKAGRPIPHMGWNDLLVHNNHPVIKGITNGDHVYFVHSYAFSCFNRSQVVATVGYGSPIAAIIARDNIIGTQFHPEKSQTTGLQFINNFLSWHP